MGKWISIQKNEIIRLGIMADWNHSYITMDKINEIAIVQQVKKLIHLNKIYECFKPVMWSIIEKTALAEAEIIYKDKKSFSTYIKFIIIESNIENLIGVKAVIWTT